MISLKRFLFMGIMMSLCIPPLNFPFDAKTFYQVAILLNNVSSSYFPGAAFLYYVLYGSENASYSYKDFELEFLFDKYSPSMGDLIIGNDYNFGGIYMFNQTVMIPIPNGRVQVIP